MFFSLFSISSSLLLPPAPCSPPPPSSPRYISFTTDACPKDELDGGGNCKRAGSWLRAIYNDRDDATPVYFAGVPKKPHVYKLFNTWYGNSGQYQNWFTADVAGGGWISTSVHQSEAMEIMIVPANGGAGGTRNNTEDKQTYTMYDNVTGAWISFCTTSCNKDKWIRENKAYRRTDAMTVQLQQVGGGRGSASYRDNLDLAPVAGGSASDSLGVAVPLLPGDTFKGTALALPTGGKACIVRLNITDNCTDLPLACYDVTLQ